jgi:hypothetical protein
MRKCPYCGREYADDYSTCPLDLYPLDSTNIKASAPASDCHPEEPDSSAEIKADPDPQPPEGFNFLGRFEPFEANRLLKRFTEAGIRFQIDSINISVFSGGGLSRGAGYLRRSEIEIFVHREDVAQAITILSSDWKV